MLLDSFTADEPVAAVRSEDARIARWSARLTTLPVALGLSVVASGLAAVLAMALGALFTEGPPAAIAALGAALAAWVVALPLALGLLKVARDAEAAQARRQAADVEGAASREAFISLIGREWARERRYGGGAALALLGIDRWRRPTSAHEAQVTMAVQRELLHCAMGALRAADAVASFGEGRLALFLAHADPTGALDAAERVRDRIEQLSIDAGGGVVRVTASVGVATLHSGHVTVGSWLTDVEQALGAARQAGGNCVRAAPVDVNRLPVPGSVIGDKRTAPPGG